MTTRGVVACSEAPKEVLGAPLLLNAGEGRPAGCPTETAGGLSMDRDPVKMAAERAAKFIIRVRLVVNCDYYACLSFFNAYISCSI